MIQTKHTVEGFLKIFDPNTDEIVLEKNNAINYEALSEAIAYSLSNRGYGEIYQMAFGSGGSSIDQTGVITYLPPNTTGQNTTLYNQTYQKIVDDTSVYNLDPTRNYMTVLHTTGNLYTDILIQCLLDYGEPSGQAAFDNSTTLDSSYTFDEIGILANYGTDSSGTQLSRLLTHVIFSPIQKSLNRQLQINYTIRIHSLSSTAS